MKTKTTLLSLFSLCFFFAFSATSAQAEDWAGYRLIGENRTISIYAKVENYRSAHDDRKRVRVWWRAV